MLEKDIVKLFEDNEYEEIEKLLSKLTKNELKETFSKREKSFVMHLFLKLSPEIAARAINRAVELAELIGAGKAVEEKIQLGITVSKKGV